MDNLPGRKGKPFEDSVHLGSESIGDDSIERIKAEEEELLKKLKDTDSERTNIETSLKLRRERLINKLTYDVEDLQKRLADMKLDNDRLNKELAEQKDVVHFSFKEKRQLVEDLEGRCRALEKEVGEKRAQDMVAASRDKDKTDDVIRLIHKFLVAEDSVVPGSLPTQELELVLQKIAKLKDDRNEKNRLARVNETQNTMMETLEEKAKSMKKRSKELDKKIKDQSARFNEFTSQEVVEFTKLQDSYKRLKAENHQIRSYANEMQTKAFKLEEKLRRIKEEEERLKQQLAKQMTDNARQK